MIQSNIPSEIQIEITGITKSGVALTKRISLSEDGGLLSDGSECVMGSGTAKRIPCTLQQFATVISNCSNRQAIALGALRPGLPDAVDVVTKSHLQKLNGSANTNNVIARTGDHISYRPGKHAFMLIDVDCKGMPPSVRDKIDDAGGYWNALISVLPELKDVGRVIRASTSTGISRTDTGQALPGSSGQHIFVLIKDGGDAERCLRTLHDRCWLAGFGWLMVGAGGQLLERSVVDRMVYAAERLVFEGAPVLDPPLTQDNVSRRAVVTDGEPLDSIAACPPLTIVEKALLEDLKSKETYRLAPDRARERSAFIAKQADRLVKRTGCTPAAARRTIEKQCDGVLLSDVALPFDDPEMVGRTVGDVMADPDKFVGTTMADPLEGVIYGKCKAKVMQRADGEVWIHSFAHGRTVYELRHSFISIEKAISHTSDDQIADLFVQMAASGDLTGEDQQRLRDEVSRRSKVNKRTLDQSVKEAKEMQDRRRHQERRNQQTSERIDPRPRIGVPGADAPWLPKMGVINDVLGNSGHAYPPARNIEEKRSRMRMRAMPLLHLLSNDSRNQIWSQNND